MEEDFLHDEFCNPPEGVNGGFNVYPKLDETKQKRTAEADSTSDYSYGPPPPGSDAGNKQATTTKSSETSTVPKDTTVPAGADKPTEQPASAPGSREHYVNISEQAKAQLKAGNTDTATPPRDVATPGAATNPNSAGVLPGPEFTRAASDLATGKVKQPSPADASSAAAQQPYARFAAEQAPTTNKSAAPAEQSKTPETGANVRPHPTSEAATTAPAAAVDAALPASQRDHAAKDTGAKADVPQPAKASNPVDATRPQPSPEAPKSLQPKAETARAIEPTTPIRPPAFDSRGGFKSDTAASSADHRPAPGKTVGALEGRGHIDKPIEPKSPLMGGRNPVATLLPNGELKGIGKKLAAVDGFIGKPDKDTRGTKRGEGADGKPNSKLDAKTDARSDSKPGAKPTDRAGEKGVGGSPLSGKNAIINSVTDKITDRINKSGEKVGDKSGDKPVNKSGAKQDSALTDKNAKPEAKPSTQLTDRGGKRLPERTDAASRAPRTESVTSRMMGIPVINNIAERIRSLRPERNESVDNRGRETRPGASGMRFNFVLKDMEIKSSTKSPSDSKIQAESKNSADAKVRSDAKSSTPVRQSSDAKTQSDVKHQTDIKDKRTVRQPSDTVATVKSSTIATRPNPTSTERVIKAEWGKVPDLSPQFDTGRLIPLLLPTGLKGIKVAAQVESTTIIKDDTAPTARVSRPEIRLHLPDGTYGGQKVVPGHRVPRFEENKAQEAATVPLKTWKPADLPVSSPSSRLADHSQVVSASSHNIEPTDASEASETSDAKDSSQSLDAAVSKNTSDVSEAGQKRKRYVNPAIDALDETLSEEDDLPASSTSTADLLLGASRQSRYLYTVKPGDTAESVAESELQDHNLAPLIIRKNTRYVLEAPAVGVTPLRAGAQIALPNPAEIAAYRKAAQ